MHITVVEVTLMLFASIDIFPSEEKNTCNVVVPVCCFLGTVIHFDQIFSFEVWVDVFIVVGQLIS